MYLAENPSVFGRKPEISGILPPRPRQHGSAASHIPSIGKRGTEFSHMQVRECRSCPEYGSRCAKCMVKLSNNESCISCRSPRRRRREVVDAVCLRVLDQAVPVIPVHGSERIGHGSESEVPVCSWYRPTRC